MALYLVACSPGNWQTSDIMNIFDSTLKSFFDKNNLTPITRLTYLVKSELSPTEIVAELKKKMPQTDEVSLFVFTANYPLAVSAKDSVALPIYQQAIEDLYNQHHSSPSEKTHITPSKPTE